MNYLDMPDYVLLEELLKTGLDKNEAYNVSHALFLKFGTLANIFEADKDALLSVEGVSEKIADAIKIVFAISKTYEKDKGKKRAGFYSFDETGGYIVRQYMSCKTERVGVLFLDSTGGNLGFEFLSEGEMDMVALPFKTLIDQCIAHEATAFILSHNHPKGTALPSASDIIYTERLANIFKNTTVRFLDHIIVAKNDYISMAQSKEYTHLFRKS